MFDNIWLEAFSASAFILIGSVGVAVLGVL
jgi:hypothetical protein